MRTLPFFTNVCPVSVSKRTSVVYTNQWNAEEVKATQITYLAKSSFVTDLFTSLQNRLCIFCCSFYNILCYNKRKEPAWSPPTLIITWKKGLLWIAGGKRKPILFLPSHQYNLVPFSLVGFFWFWYQSTKKNLRQLWKYLKGKVSWASSPSPTLPCAGPIIIVWFSSTTMLTIIITYFCLTWKKTRKKVPPRNMRFSIWSKYFCLKKIKKYTFNFSHVFSVVFVYIL